MAAFSVVVADDHVGHAPPVEVQGGVALPAYDQARRIDEITAALGAEADYALRAPEAHGLQPILATHSPELVEFLATAWERFEPLRPPGAPLVFADTFPHERLRAAFEQPPRRRSGVGDPGAFCFDTITGIGPGTFTAACGAVDVALSVVAEVSAAASADAGAPAALGLTRPPGHHVSRDLFGGGCYLNNAAIAAQQLRDGGAARVAILDLDYHHGNGTQALFYDRGDVLYASLHGSPERAYPYFTGFEDERGLGAGAGATVNVTLPEGVDGEAYLRLLGPVLARIRAFTPAALVVSLGLDTFGGDPTGDAALTRADLEAVGQEVGALALPSVLLLEGGYDIENLGANTLAWLAGFRERR
jgi:acetoin utilization deacetylase AcuC-like enzyme